MSPSVEPFNESKYKALMDGLEACEKNLSEVRIDNEVFRFDAEYFNKEALALTGKIKSRPYRLIGDGFEVSKLAGFEYTEYFTPVNMESASSYIALTSKNILNNRLMLNDYITIDKKVADEFLQRSKLKPSDVVMSYTGEYRRALTLFEDGYQLGPNVCRISKKNNLIDPCYLSVFLNSKCGQILLDKEKTISAQPTIAMQRIRKIPVPVFNELQQSVSKIVVQSNDLLGKAAALHRQAEDLLNEYLHLDATQESTRAVKTLSESFLVSGRLDAEYYQPKYDKLFEFLRGHATANLGDIVNIKKSIEPGSGAYQDEGIPFIRVSDIDKFGIYDPEIKLDHSVVPDIESLYPKKDTILLSKDGTVGIAYKVQEDLQSVTSGALLHLTIKDGIKVLPDYLTLVLNSEVVQLQAERDCNGGNIQHWKPSQIEKVVIPVFDMVVQQKIADKVQESFKLRNDSKRLLDNAIKAVEMAIETDENTASQWLAGQLQNGKTNIVSIC